MVKTPFKTKDIIDKQRLQIKSDINNNSRNLSLKERYKSVKSAMGEGGLKLFSLDTKRKSITRNLLQKA